RSSFYLFGSLGALLGLMLLVLLREPARARSTETEQQKDGDSDRSNKDEAATSRVGPSLLVPQPFPRGCLLSLRNMLSPIGELFANPMVRILTLVFVGANFVAMIFLTWM